MTRARISVITFDLDDTLWDVRPVLLEAERRLQLWLGEHARGVPEVLADGGAQALRTQLVGADPSLAHQLSRLRTAVLHAATLSAGYREPHATVLAGQAFEVFLAARQEVTLFDGVGALLQSLGQQYRLGALSNGNADLKRLECGALFDFHFSAETVGAAKPHPALFHAAFAHTRVTADEVLHVGDSAEHDVLGAQRAGVRSVWVNVSGNPFPADAARPTAEVRSVLELPEVLRVLNAAG